MLKLLLQELSTGKSLSDHLPSKKPISLLSFPLFIHHKFFPPLFHNGLTYRFSGLINTTSSCDTCALTYNITRSVFPPFLPIKLTRDNC